METTDPDIVDTKPEPDQAEFWELVDHDPIRADNWLRRTTEAAARQRTAAGHAGQTSLR